MPFTFQTETQNYASENNPDYPAIGCVAHYRMRMELFDDSDHAWFHFGVLTSFDVQKDLLGNIKQIALVNDNGEQVVTHMKPEQDQDKLVSLLGSVTRDKDTPIIVQLKMGFDTEDLVDIATDKLGVTKKTHGHFTDKYRERSNTKFTKSKDDYASAVESLASAIAQKSDIGLEMELSSHLRHHAGLIATQLKKAINNPQYKDILEWGDLIQAFGKYFGFRPETGTDALLSNLNLIFMSMMRRRLGINGLNDRSLSWAQRRGELQREAAALINWDLVAAKNDTKKDFLISRRVDEARKVLGEVSDNDWRSLMIDVCVAYDKAIPVHTDKKIDQLTQAFVLIMKRPLVQSPDEILPIKDGDATLPVRDQAQPLTQTTLSELTRRRRQRRTHKLVSRYNWVYFGKIADVEYTENTTVIANNKGRSRLITKDHEAFDIATSEAKDKIGKEVYICEEIGSTGRKSTFVDIVDATMGLNYLEGYVLQALSKKREIDEQFKAVAEHDFLEARKVRSLIDDMSQEMHVELEEVQRQIKEKYERKLNEAKLRKEELERQIASRKDEEERMRSKVASDLSTYSDKLDSLRKTHTARVGAAHRKKIRDQQKQKQKKAGLVISSDDIKPLNVGQTVAIKDDGTFTLRSDNTLPMNVVTGSVFTPPQPTGPEEIEPGIFIDTNQNKTQKNDEDTATLLRIAQAELKAERMEKLLLRTQNQVIKFKNYTKLDRDRLVQENAQADQEVDAKERKNDFRNRMNKLAKELKSAVEEKATLTLNIYGDHATKALACRAGIPHQKDKIQVQFLDFLGGFNDYLVYLPDHNAQIICCPDYDSIDKTKLIIRTFKSTDLGWMEIEKKITGFANIQKNIPLQKYLEFHQQISAEVFVTDLSTEETEDTSNTG